MTNTERQAVLNFKITGTETVGEIKNHLKDLKKVLNDTTKGSEEYKESVKGIAETQRVLTGVMNETKFSVDYAKGSYNALNQELVNTRRAYKELSEEERNSASGQEMLQKIQNLDGELKSLDASIGQYQRNVGHYQLALEALNKTYDSSRAELAGMKKAMDNLDPSTKEYAQAFERAAQLTHELQDRQEMLKYASRDLGDQLSNIRGIASNMAAGFSAAQAAIGLFGGESEDVQKAMLKVQQAMALVQGLQGLDGLIKRTQGLSTALGVSKTATNAQTTATNSQTVATEGATVAQKGLNAAMKANPIGVVIIAIQALITVWALFKDKIIEAIGGQERLNDIFNRTIPVVKGVGNAILQFLLTPIKQAVVGIKGMARVVEDILHGEFKKAWQDAGQTIVEWKNTAVSGISFVSNYQKAASEARVKIEEKETQKKKEQYDKDKDNYIKDQEAKEGSDWKYTEEGKKAYEELYKNRMGMYKKDSEEYRQAQRDMWSYSRDYEDRKKKDAAATAAAAKAAAKQAVSDAKANAKAIQDAYKTEVAEYIQNDLIKAFDKANGRMKAFIDMLVLSGVRGMDKIKVEADNILKTNDVGTAYGMLSDLLLGEGGAKVAEAGLTATLNELLNKIRNDVAKPFVDNILDYNAKVETHAKATADALAFAFSSQEFKDGINYPVEALQYAANELAVWDEAYEKEKEKIQETLDALKAAGMEHTDEYEKLQVKMTEVHNQQRSKRLEYMQKESDIMKQTYDKQIEDTKTFYDEQKRLTENSYNEKNFGGDASSKFYNSSIRNIISGVMPNEERAMMEELHKIQMEALEKRKGILQEMVNDSGLANEERVNAEKELAQTMAEIEDAELQHTMEMNQHRADSWKMYVDMAQDAVGAIGDLMGNLADYYEADIEAKVKAGKMTEAEADKQFENIKKMRIAEATINTIAGAIGAFLQATATYPPPYGEIIGGISAAAVTAAGMAEIARIKSSDRNGSGGGGGSGMVYATATPVMTDFNPQGVTNITGGEETEDLKNALASTQIVVSVVDINDAQNKVKVRDDEARW